MDEFDQLFDKLVEEMDKQNIDYEIQKKYLIELMKLINKQEEQKIYLTNTFIISSLYFGTGMGLITLSHDNLEMFISILTIILGLSISIIQKVKTKNIPDYLDDYEELEKIRKEIESCINLEQKSLTYKNK